MAISCLRISLQRVGCDGDGGACECECKCKSPPSMRSIQMTKNGLAASPSSYCHCDLGGIVVTTSRHCSNTAQIYHDTSQGVEEDAPQLVGPRAH